VIGVRVGVHADHQLELQFGDEIQILIFALLDRIDDECLTADPRGEQIRVRVRVRDGVE
jgi:hypothetical protein